MERLEYRVRGSGMDEFGQAREALVGVVGSGNLEVMIEPADLGGDCLAVIETSITGFGAIWQQVVEDFFARNRLANVKVSINDGGATPAVVSLRLDQALAHLREQQA